jgi:hypothetical protein
MALAAAQTRNQTATATSTKHSKDPSDLEEFRNVALEYVNDVLHRDTIDILPGVRIERKTNNSTERAEEKSFDAGLASTIRHFTESHVVRINLARAATETGRLFFFKGMRGGRENICYGLGSA